MCTMRKKNIRKQKKNRAENTKPLNKNRVDKFALKYKARTAKKGFVPFSPPNCSSFCASLSAATPRSTSDRKPVHEENEFTAKEEDTEK